MPSTLIALSGVCRIVASITVSSRIHVTYAACNSESHVNHAVECFYAQFQSNSECRVSTSIAPALSYSIGLHV